MKPTMITVKRGVALSIFLLIGVCIFGQAAADCVDYGSGGSPVGTLRGLSAVPTGIVVSGTTAFMTVNGALIVADVSDPSAPQQIATLQVPGINFGLVKSGSSVFIATNNSGLQIVDVSNPNQPALVGSWDDGSGNAIESIAGAGSILYVAYSGSGLKVLDVSNPSAPSVIGSLLIPTRIVALSGWHLYMQNGHRVVVVDVTNPASPQEMGSVMLSSLPMGLAALGTRVYVSTELAGLQIVDATNLVSPSVVGQLPPTDGQVYRSSVAISGTRLYMANFANHATLQVIDVTDPSSPSPLGTVPGPIYTVALSRYFLYAGAFDPQVGTKGNLIVGPLQCLTSECVDYGSGAIPLGTLRGLSAVPTGIVVSGITAFMTVNGALIVADVSDPSAPQQIATLSVPGINFGLVLSGSSVFIATNNSGLQIVDVSNPNQPALIGSWDDGSGNAIESIAGEGSILYVAYSGGGLKVLDVSNASAPSVIGSLLIPTRIVALSGSRLYMQNGHRIVVVDVTNPTSPQELGSVMLSSLPMGLVALGTRVYVSTELAGLQIVDASNPASPSVVGQLPPTDGQVYRASVAISGTNLYMANFANHATLQVIDVSDPSSPSPLGTVPGLIYTVALSQYFLYAGAFDQAKGNLIVGPLQCLSSGGTTGILPGDGKGHALGLAYPNPSLGKSTMIPFSLPRSGAVTLRILDISGREVRTLVNQVMGEGNQVAKWDGRNNQGELVPTGIYFYQLRTADIREAQRLVRVRN